MPKSDFNKIALQLYRNHTLTWVFSCRFTGYFLKAFFQGHLWRDASVSKLVGHPLISLDLLNFMA